MKLGTRIEPYVRSFIQYGNAYGKIWWERVEMAVRVQERMPAWNMVPRDPEDVKLEQIENPDAPTHDEVQVPIGESMDALFAKNWLFTSWGRHELLASSANALWHVLKKNLVNGG